MDRRTSGIPLPSSSLPRRAPSPSSAAFSQPAEHQHQQEQSTERPASRISYLPQPTPARSSASTGTGSSAFGYSRPTSRGAGIAESQLPGPGVAATPSASRIGYGYGGASASASASASGAGAGLMTRSAAPPARTYNSLAGRASLVPNGATSGAGGAALPASASIGKRTISAAGIGADDADDLAKRRAGGPSPSALQRPPSRGESPAGSTTSTSAPSSTAYELRMLRAEHERRALADQRAYAALETEMKRQGRELDRLKRERLDLLGEWEAEQERKKERELQWETEQSSLQTQLRTLRAQLSSLEEAHNDLQTSSTSSTQSLRSETTLLRTQLATAQADVGVARAEVESAREAEARIRAERDDLERRLEEEEMERRRERDELRLGGEEGKRIGEELSRQTAHVRKLETSHAHLTAENSRLKQHATSVEVLKEEKRALEARVRGIDELRDGLAAAEEKVRALEEEKADWKELLEKGLPADLDAAFAASASVEGPIPDLPTPIAITTTTLPGYLSKIRGSAAGLQARARGLLTSLESLREHNARLEEQARMSAQQAAQAAKEHAETKTALARAQKAEERMVEEVQRYKVILQSYDTEEKTHKASYDAANAERIAFLEGQVESQRQEVARLSAEVEQKSEEMAKMAAKAAAAPPSPVVDEAQIQKARESAEKAEIHAQGLQKALDEARQAHESLLKEAQPLAEEIETLRDRLGRGEYNPEREMVIGLADNPVSQDLAIRKADLDRLRKENGELLKQLEVLAKNASAAAAVAPAHEEGKGGQGGQEGEAAEAAAMVPKQTVENLKLDIKGLQESVKLKEKTLLRLKQVFSAKALEFREAVESLFGYRLKFLDNGKVQVRSSYARGPRGTTLIFRSEGNDRGQMRLQGEANEGLANVRQLREYWLMSGVRESIPCFLAALNLELYESTTQAVRVGWAQEEEDEEEGQA